MNEYFYGLELFILFGLFLVALLWVMLRDLLAANEPVVVRDFLRLGECLDCADRGQERTLIARNGRCQRCGSDAVTMLKGVPR